MCQVHTGAYVSIFAPGKTDYIACHPRKTTSYHVYITRSIYRYAYARQTQVNWKEEESEKKEENGKEKKERQQNKKDKTRRGSKEKKREEKCLTSRP